jgi:glycosyltransferase-like protein
VPYRIVRHEPAGAPFDERIRTMLEAYTEGLAEPLGDGGFDLIHSQDCLSANAALALRDLGVIDRMIRTVHHIDDFISPSLIECQNRSIVDPDVLLCVSEPWVRRLADEFGVDARLVRNGVDCRRHRPARDPGERSRDRGAVGLDGHLTVLSIGGIEPRKGSLTLLEAFAHVRELVPALDPLLVVAGGATLFDYRHEIDRFHARTAELGLGRHVRVLGSLTDEELARVCRAADLFAFPSTNEGFGLAALEALAYGLPVVATDLDALRTFLEHGRSVCAPAAGRWWRRSAGMPLRPRTSRSTPSCWAPPRSGECRRPKSCPSIWRSARAGRADTNAASRHAHTRSRSTSPRSTGATWG